MKNTVASRFLTVALSLSIPGCAAQFAASASATASPTHAEAHATVRADVDPRLAAAGALLGTGIVLASRAASHGSHATVTTSSGGERGGRENDRGATLVAAVETLTLASEHGAVTYDVRGGTLSLLAPGASGDVRITGGTVLAAPASGGGWTLTGGTVELSDGSARSVSGGTIDLAQRDDGRGWVVARGSLDAGAVSGASAVVRRVGVSGASVAEVDGGTMVLEGIGARGDLTVVDGALDVAEGLGADGRWGARGGRVLVEDVRGHRWRCTVRGGWVRARSAGQGGRWAFAGGELSLRVTAEGDATLALADDRGNALGDAAGTVDVTLAPRVMASLDTLMTSAPAGSRDALRAAAAVQTVIHDAESADANVYGVPVVGSPVVLVLDVSYSMSEPDPHGATQALDPQAPPSKLDVARAEVVKLLAEMPDGAAADVVAFSTAVQMLWPAPRALDAAARGEAIRWLAGLRPQDETHPLPAAQLAADMAPGQLVLVGDGRPSDAGESNAGLLAVADAMRVAGGRLDVVGLGDDQDAAFLDVLAAHGAGVARHR